jgi:glycerol-3-phosphate dehydrogenase
MGEGVARVVQMGGAVKQFAAVALGVCAGLLLGFAVKAGMQWYGCKAYGLFSDTYCALQVLMR